MATTFQMVRAEALFVSMVQESQRPTADEVREAISTVLRMRGIRGCAGAVAQEFGEHPDLAIRRMTWAITAVDTVYASVVARPVPAQAA
jgi:UDP:flavonoid glycosyltransferase YjiC (YdhE family)